MLILDPVRFYVDDIRPVSWNNEAYDHLVYSEEQKDLILTFVKNHQQMKEGLDDVIVGKGTFGVVLAILITLIGRHAQVKVLSLCSVVLQVPAKHCWQKLVGPCQFFGARLMAQRYSGRQNETSSLLLTSWRARYKCYHFGTEHQESIPDGDWVERCHSSRWYISISLSFAFLANLLDRSGRFYGWAFSLWCAS